MIDKQKLEQMIDFHEKENDKAYYLFSERYADIEEAYNRMGKKYYNPLGFRKKYFFYPIHEIYLKLKFNYRFKRENKKHARMINNLLGIRKYYDTSLREKIKQGENIIEVNKKLEHLEKLILQTDDAIDIYKSIIKEKVEDWKPGY